MAKRFTDTEKWKKQFFKSLNQCQMLFWNFINDDCDHAGAWYVDLEVASMRIKEKIDLPEMIQAFNHDEERVVLFDSGKKLLIKSFVLFQYGLNPSEKNRLHIAAEKTLNHHGFDWFNGAVTALERPMGTGKEKDKEKEIKGGVGGINAKNKLSVKGILANELFCRLTQEQKNILCDQYPEDFLINTLSQYIASAETNRIFVMHPRTVFNWLERDFQKPAHGRAESRREKLKKQLEEIDYDKTGVSGRDSFVRRSLPENGV